NSDISIGHQTDHQLAGSSSEICGTHYIKSIIKGGSLLVSFRVQATKPEYLEEVRNVIDSHLGNSGIIEEELTEKLKDLSEALKSKVFVNRQYWASGIGLHSPPSSMKEVSNFALQFPTLVKNTGDGKGSLLDIEVVDLHTVASNFTEYKTNPHLGPVLREVFAKLDDIRVAKSEFESWMDNNNFRKED
ncbi:uncharacterized protein TNIN_203331, partial [Trichonephila inaurata madagascariensis]